MTGEPLILLTVRITAGFISSFLAIWIWSKTRDAAWLMIVLGTLFYFGDTLLWILDQVGIPVFSILTVNGISLIRLLTAVLPFIFFSIGFIIFLIRKRWY